MAELSDILKGLLDDPKTGERLKSILGGDNQQPEKEITPSVTDLLPGGFDPRMIKKMADVMSRMDGKKNDDRTRLLNDLKPYISKGRQKRIDESIEMLRLLWVIDLLREGDINEK